MGSNDVNSFIRNILIEWNMVSESNDVVEFMTEMGLIVDIYPFQIKDLEKSHQVEVFYRKFLDKDISRKTYLTYENNFLKFIKLLWTYNETNLFYDLAFDNYFLKAFKKICFTKKRKKSNTVNNISNWAELQTLSVVSLRESGYMFLHFKDWNVIAMINDFSVLLMCKDAETNKTICKLANHCGLFMR